MNQLEEFTAQGHNGVTLRGAFRTIFLQKKRIFPCANYY